MDQSARYADLSLKEEDLVKGGKHILVAYKMKPKPGFGSYLSCAAHFAAESSTGTNVEATCARALRKVSNGSQLANIGVRKPNATGLQVLWITPLRALAADTLTTLQTTIDELHVPWILEGRTGDTPPSVRRKQQKRLPEAMITTPESLSLLMSRRDAA